MLLLLNFVDLIFKQVLGAILVHVSLLKYLGSIFNSWDKNKKVTKGNERLPHTSHQHHNENGKDVECNVDKLRALLDKSVVDRVVFELLLLLLEEFVRPNVVILEVDKVSQHVV
jgi:hypothetical protein